MNKSIFGLDENLAAALAYVGTFVTGIIVLILERENKFVRFAALQSTVFFLGLALITWFVGWIPILGWIASRVSGIVIMAAVIYLVFMAFKGQAVKLPIVGDICWEQVHK